MLGASLIGVIIGMLIGRFLRTDEDCPRRASNWQCQGKACDHRKSELYRAKMQMALADEEMKKDFWSDGYE